MVCAFYSFSDDVLCRRNSYCLNLLLCCVATCFPLLRTISADCASKYYCRNDSRQTETCYEFICEIKCRYLLLLLLLTAIGFSPGGSSLTLVQTKQ
jgi:hypothetical protein